MLEHELRADDGILVLHPHGSLQAADFTSLTAVVDDYLQGGGRLRGVLISGTSFPGWADLDALLAHLKFVKNHHARIDRVAIVAHGAVARAMPNLASHFVRAQVRHFDEDGAAWRWLTHGPGQVVHKP
jgi:hypothetical protein